MSFDHRLTGMLLVAAMTLGFAGCNGGFITFTVTQKSDKQTIQGSDNPLNDVLGDLNPLSFNINLEQQLEKRDADSVQEVRLRELNMMVTDYAGDGPGNFDFLESIEFYVDSENQDRRRLAWLEEVPEGQQTLTLNTDESINLQPYIDEGMTLETDASGDKPDEDTTIQGEVTIWIKAL